MTDVAVLHARLQPGDLCPACRARTISCTFPDAPAAVRSAFTLTCACGWALLHQMTVTDVGAADLDDIAAAVAASDEPWRDGDTEASWYTRAVLAAVRGAPAATRAAVAGFRQDACFHRIGQGSHPRADGVCHAGCHAVYVDGDA